MKGKFMGNYTPEQIKAAISKWKTQLKKMDEPKDIDTAYGENVVMMAPYTLLVYTDAWNVHMNCKPVRMFVKYVKSGTIYLTHDQTGETAERPPSGDYYIAFTDLEDYFKIYGQLDSKGLFSSKYYFMANYDEEESETREWLVQQIEHDNPDAFCQCMAPSDVMAVIENTMKNSSDEIVADAWDDFDVVSKIYVDLYNSEGQDILLSQPSEAKILKAAKKVVKHEI